MMKMTNVLKRILQSAWDFRDLNKGVYGLDSVMLNVWTSAEPLPEILLDFFNMTAENALDRMDSSTGLDSGRSNRSRGGILEANTIVKLGMDQLVALARAVFRCFDERLMWLERCVVIEFRVIFSF